MCVAALGAGHQGGHRATAAATTLIVPFNTYSCSYHRCNHCFVAAIVIAAVAATTSSYLLPHKNIHPCEERCHGASAGAWAIISDGGHG